MNAVFELEVHSFRTELDKYFACPYIRGQIVPQNSPSVTEAISIVIGSGKGTASLFSESLRL